MSLPTVRPIRCLITAGSATPIDFHEKVTGIIETVRASADAGIELVQLREKALHARQLFHLTRGSVEALKGTRTKVLVNERFDIAIAAGADGVHLTSHGLPVQAVRSILPSHFVIGVSAHSLAEVIAARNGGADYALFGPVFATPGKGEPSGLDALREVCETVWPFPVLAVGGIDETNIASVLDHGAPGFGAIRYLNDFVRIAK